MVYDTTHQNDSGDGLLLGLHGFTWVYDIIGIGNLIGLTVGATISILQIYANITYSKNRVIVNLKGCYQQKCYHVIISASLLWTPWPI